MKFQKRQNGRDRMQINDCQGPGAGGKRLTSTADQWAFWSNGNVLYLECSDDYTIYALILKKKEKKRKAPQRQQSKQVGLTEGK